jgi:DNA-binding GntR family transcriptional regulator
MAENGADLAPAHGETVAHIVERLRDDILARRMAPGARLVEADLTQRFSVSRGPIREALRRLAAEGLIEHVPNRGALVRRLSVDDIRDLFQIRMELESLAARLAATAPEPEKRARFEQAIAPIFDERPRETCAYLIENADFHAAVMELAGNRQLKELALKLQLPLIMAQVGDILTPQVLEDSVREHRVLATAIIARDELAADAAMRAHLGRAAVLAVARATQCENEPRRAGEGELAELRNAATAL